MPLAPRHPHSPRFLPALLFQTVAARQLQLAAGVFTLLLLDETPLCPRLILVLLRLYAHLLLLLNAAFVQLNQRDNGKLNGLVLLCFGGLGGSHGFFERGEGVA